MYEPGKKFNQKGGNMQTFSTTEPSPIELVERLDGLYDLYLRKDIKQITEQHYVGEGQTEEYSSWCADEVKLVGRYTREYAVAHFDELWDKAIDEQTPLEDKVARTRAATLDIATSVADLYMAMMGGLDD